MTLDTWLPFFGVALVATLVPGPAMLLIATHSLSYGWRRSIATILGNVSGLVILSSLSVLGLGALIVSSYTAFLIVKFCGSAYLFYLGLKIWRSGIKPIDAQALAFPAKTSNLYLQGIVLALSNPKAIIFTAALFPQFVKIDQSVPLQFIIFALTLCSLSFTCLLGCAFISRKSFTTVRSSSIGNALSKVFGSAFMGAGIWLLATVKVART